MLRDSKTPAIHYGCRVAKLTRFLAASVNLFSRARPVKSRESPTEIRHFAVNGRQRARIRPGINFSRAVERDHWVDRRRTGRRSRVNSTHERGGEGKGNSRCTRLSDIAVRFTAAAGEGETFSLLRVAGQWVFGAARLTTAVFPMCL